MSLVFDEWKKAFDDLNGSVEKSLAEIRKCKAAIQSVRPAYVNMHTKGRCISDEDRIVLSAPEIIIGNVDKEGNLWAGQGSTVIIRATDISLEGTSGTGICGGSITSRASSIRNIAVDPGIDGQENALGRVSEIINQGKCITLCANKDKSSIISAPSTDDGVNIHSDSTVSIDAAASCDVRKKHIEESLTAYNKSKSEQKKRAGDLKKNMESVLGILQKLLKEDMDQSTDVTDIRSSIGDLNDRRIEFERSTALLTSILRDYTAQLSSLAETCRVINSLEEEKKIIPQKEQFTKASSKARVLLNGEKITVTTTDGDGNLRTSPDAGFDVTANNIRLNATNPDNTLLEKGKIAFNAKDIDISTANTKIKDQEERKEADILAEGNLHIHSKTVSIEATDQQYKDKKFTEKALTKGGRLDIRVESTSISATDTDGKATGSVMINAKETELKATNVKKDDRSDDKIAEGGSLLLTAEKVYAGSRDKTNKTKQLQIVADKTAIFGDTTTEIQQGEGKAIVQMDGGNLAMSGGKTELYGATTVYGAADFKADIKAPKAAIENLEAKKSFKSPNISDGIGVPGAPSSSKLSAKLKMEEKKSKPAEKK